jgi:HEAT repeat protein
MLVISAAVAFVIWGVAQHPRGPTYKGRSLNFWVSELSRTNQALIALSSMGSAVIPLLLDQVRPKAEDRVLERFHRRLWSMLPPPLQQYVTGPKPSEWLLKYKISAAITRMGASAVPSLCKALNDPDCVVRFVAVDALRSMGRGANAAVPALADVLSRTDCDLRLEVATALTYLGPKATAALPALILSLKNSPGRELEGKVDYFVIGASLDDESVVQAIIPALLELANNADAAVRVEATVALWRIKHDSDTVQRLAEELDKSTGPDVCRRILQAFLRTGLGPEVKSARPAIERSVQRFGASDSEIRFTGRAILTAIENRSIRRMD